MDLADIFMLTRTIWSWRGRKLVCTPDGNTNLKKKLHKMDIVDVCTREGANTRWKFHKLTNLTVFAALLKDVPMGCKNSVLPEPLLKNKNVNCLTFEENTRKPYNDSFCLFRAVALHLFDNKILMEEKSKIFNIFLNNCSGADPSKFQGVHMTEIPKVEEMLAVNAFLYEIGFVDGELIGKLVVSQTFTLQQSDLLRQRHGLFLYIFSLQHM